MRYGHFYIIVVGGASADRRLLGNKAGRRRNHDGAQGAASASHNAYEHDEGLLEFAAISDQNSLKLK
jgi:hypothetical protein